MQLGRAARQIYLENAPKNERFQSSMAQIDQWLASESARNVVAAHP
jgi:hypothetical protein